MKKMKKMKDYEEVVRNPFSPNFGQLPSLFLDREQIIDKYLRVLKGSANQLEWTTIFSGIRGSGKTVILGEIAKEAVNDKWLVLKLTAGGNLENESLALLEMESKKLSLDLSSFSVGFFGLNAGVSFKPDQPVSSWRTKIMEFLDHNSKQIKGILLCVDEVQKVDESLKLIAKDYQLLLQDNYAIALCMAGLPNAISDVLNNTVLTFLRRSDQIYLSSLEFENVLNSYRTIFSNSGFKIESEVIRQMAKMTSGYPFLYQLIGYYSFSKYFDKKVITMKDLEWVKSECEKQMQKSVLQPILQDLSDRDREFLKAMSEDDSKSRISDIAGRMNVKQSYISQYRRRLIAAGIIVESGRGYVNFAVPLLREFMRNPNPIQIMRGFQDMSEYGE
jgi:hypothetical protein